jgi:two-component system phosphate regulon sensor histidine kinase PhoR
MALVAPDGRLLQVNPAMGDMLGYEAEQLSQGGFQEITHPDDLAHDLAMVRRCLAGDIDSYRLRKRYLHRDGRVVWGDLSAALVRGPDGRPLHLISQILDVTEQQEQQERLRTANAERERQVLEAIFATVGVGLLLIGQDGRYERMNRRQQETMQVPFPDGHDGVAGQLGHVYHLDGRTLMTQEQMPSYRATQGEEFDDYACWAGDDPLTRAAYSTSARQVRSAAGEPLGAALAYQDITDLMRAMKVKDEFVSSVARRGGPRRAGAARRGGRAAAGLEVRRDARARRARAPRLAARRAAGAPGRGQPALERREVQPARRLRLRDPAPGS